MLLSNSSMAHEIVPFISDVMDLCQVIVRELVYDLSNLLDSIFWCIEEVAAS